ncbi:MAG: UDP-N-acetylglucosamine 1-carboxyvinyltransferase [Vampirovibrionales bacterium]
MSNLLEKYVITGGQRLTGNVHVSGAKNSVLKLMAAALLTNDEVTLTNVPALSDVAVMNAVLASLGRKTEHSSGSLTILAGSCTTTEAPYELVSKMRASFDVLGALLGKYGEAQVPLPGGCSIGKRGVDQHIKGLEALGAELTMEHGTIHAKASQLQGCSITLDMPSVGATENILLASVLAQGVTTLFNAAQEPEIADLCHFLNALGANIQGMGSSQLVITGVSPHQLHGTTYSVLPDRIEAATFLLASVATGGDVVVERMRLNDLAMPVEKLMAMGGIITDLGSGRVRIQGPSEQRLKATSYVTSFYPSFPTDLQSPFMAVLSVAEGVSMISETIYENRFKHVGELIRMGATIQVQNDVAIVTGVERLSGASVKAHDLRAGAAMVLAGMMAEGESQVFNLNHIDRGYECFHEKLVSLGASIIRTPLSDKEHAPVLGIL